jgi:hypothetical protein
MLWFVIFTTDAPDEVAFRPLKAIFEHPRINVPWKPNVSA